MEEIIIHGESGLLKMSFQEPLGFPDTTSYFGGYDVQSAIEIVSEGFSVKSTFWTSTGEFFEFYSELVKRNEQVSGTVCFTNYAEKLKFSIQYDITGHVIIQGTFVGYTQLNNSLKFELRSDQSYLQSTLLQLRGIVGKYGGMEGVKK